MPKLRAILLNCSLKSGKQKSSTQAMLEEIVKIYDLRGVESEIIRVADKNIKFGVETDMGKGDEWPEIHDKILKANIVIIGCPIWIGHRSSVCQMVLERMDALLNETNEKGQLPLYDKVGGVCVVGNEDGAQAVAAGVLYNLMQYGATIPPNAEAYWVGEAGGEDDYVDVGMESEYTQGLVKYLGNNTVILARMLQENTIPPEGNKAQ